MAIPELALRRAEKLLGELIDRRVPERFRDEIRMSVEVRGNGVALFEDRPVWRMPGQWSHRKIAQFRYEPASEQWSLFWTNRHRQWLRYEGKRPTADVASLIREVDTDPVGAFFG